MVASFSLLVQHIGTKIIYLNIIHLGIYTLTLKEPWFSLSHVKAQSLCPFLYKHCLLISNHIALILYKVKGFIKMMKRVLEMKCIILYLGGLNTKKITKRLYSSTHLELLKYYYMY